MVRAPIIALTALAAASLAAQGARPPAVKPDSAVRITFQRNGCDGTCPAYKVTLTTGAIAFDANSLVVAPGTHRDAVDAASVRALAQKFIASGFYSMRPKYVAGVTDCQTYALSIDIDGQRHEVMHYIGAIGAPPVLSELEGEVDSLAKTSRWMEGTDGLVESLQREHFNFHSVAAQNVLKAAAERGQTNTVRRLIEAGVPLTPLPTPKSASVSPYTHIGWLDAAGAGAPRAVRSTSTAETIRVLIAAGASKNDQADKDLALAESAGSGNLEAVRALLAYGANPGASLKQLPVAQGLGLGSILISAAHSGSPGIVREILSHHPPLEARTSDGRTALFVAAVGYPGSQKDARAACVRLLAEAGANVNASDNAGNTPLHSTFDADVEKELLRLGADVNARNHAGETPIFTAVDEDAIPLLLRHGADLTLRNNKGQTALEAAASRNNARREEALRNAIANAKAH